MSERVSEWRYRLLPSHAVGEILSKNWIDNAIPVVFLAVSIATFANLTPLFFSPTSLSFSGRELGELLLIVMAMAVVMQAGGIDLSVGSTFALTAFVSLALFNAFALPVPVIIGASIILGSLVGLINGVLIGYLRLRAFLTTLVTLIIVRACVDALVLEYQVKLSMPIAESDTWYYLGEGTILGVPLSAVIAIVIAIVGHVFLTRMKYGWHIQAVGGSRRSAHNAGIKVRRTVCMTYVLSGALTGLAGVLYAARFGTVGSDTGLSLEVTALTAAVLGGNSLGGGRGSMVKAILGTLIVFIVTRGLIQLGVSSGISSLVLGLILLLAVAVDVKWLKNRYKILSSVYMSPAYFKLQPSAVAVEDGAFAPNDKLAGIERIGFEQVDGSEDVVLDAAGNLYTGSRHGDVVRFLAPDHKQMEVFAHTGGHPLGMQFDADGNLYACVGEMGIYMITPEREVVKLSDETNRNWLSIIDDSRMRLPDDLDIVPDGRVFFSEATVRFDLSDWMIDALESRGNGRIICYDPRNKTTTTVLRNLQFPNGICSHRDGQSILFAETWGCRISRYWYDGPRKGQTQVVMDNLPGYPDNINRASDGTYWCAIVGMRAPAFDIAMRFPAFRTRMVKRIPSDEWLYPNMNTGFIFKFDDDGKVLDCLWDEQGADHATMTSMREHKGHLYIGSLYNNRIGRYAIPGADPEWTGTSDYWGAGR
jgi:ribose transport system permease protein